MLKTILEKIKATLQLKDINSIIFSNNCITCNKTNSIYCAGCTAHTPLFYNYLCFICKKISQKGQTHLNCQNTFNIKSVFSLYAYNIPSIQELIIQYKYHNNAEISQILINEQCKSSLKQHILIEKKAFLIPIPLHQLKYNYRGYNQSQKIAEQIHSLNDSWQVLNLLQRIKFTKTQKDLTKQERQKNVLNVFSINSDIEKESSINKDSPLILVDDVITSGNTLISALKLLTDNGYTNIHFLTLTKEINY